MRLCGSPSELRAKLYAMCPASERAVTETAYIVGQMEAYQYAALYTLARQYDGGRILEIGSFKGRSAIIMAYAAPTAWIVTMTPSIGEANTARQNAGGRRIEVITTGSWEYLQTYGGPTLDMIYVDGDHRNAIRDVPWFNWLRVGGLILFHDYSPVCARVPCPNVYDAVNQLGQRLGRMPDVLVVDTDNLGMAGFVRQEGESWA